MIELVLSAAIDCPNQSCPTVCSIHLQFLPSIRDQISIPSWRIFVLTLTIFQGTMYKLCTPHWVFVQKISGFFVFSLIDNNGFLVLFVMYCITTLFLSLVVIMCDFISGVLCHSYSTTHKLLTNCQANLFPLLYKTKNNETRFLR